ncbi:AraC family transcriptional regulator ligand-binding domain-containing protein [Hoeflea sp. TYP-13]|uniref:AraC family transcriptional regulator ligand-binding domain-containing protein n=1 Tax=Hoeflea sp. TYP-13 TaxID=3230023 RepID=UPI0034C61919
MPRRFKLDPGFRVILAELKVDPREMISRAGLPPIFLHYDPAALTGPEYLRLWEALCEMCDPVDLALTAAKLAALTGFSPSLFAATCSPTYEIAVDRLRAYKSLLGPFTLRLERTEDVLSITPEPAPELDYLPGSLAAAEVAFQQALITHALREAVNPVRVVMPPEFASDTRVKVFFGVLPHAGTEASISYSLRDARKPFLTHDSSMWDFFEPELQRRLSAVNAHSSAVEMTRAALIELLPSGESAIGAVAKRIAHSPRTLQRRLDEEGATFKQILGEVRRDLALAYIEKDTATPDIAFLLAYNEINSFTRAFKGWEGMTPDAYRARHR